MTPKIYFTLDDKQVLAFREWEKEVYAKGVEKQKAEITDPDEVYLFCWEDGFPYCGAIGGQFTFSFTPTSIGEMVRVVDAVTKEKLDLTDWDHF